MPTIYRKKDGTLFTPEEVKDTQRRFNRRKGARKAALTRAPSVYIPGRTGTARQYVALFDGINHLSSLNYAWQEHPQAHFDHRGEPE